MEYLKVYEEWSTNPYFDPDTRRELEGIRDNPKEITDRFYRNLEFGTGGLRGVLGAGTNRMNIYTVRLATQGLANYILKQNGQEKGVVIAHDSRLMSPEFSREAALCLNANGIRTYLFESLRPTPELSFAVRQLGCIAGICVTASHNPREYNGYKVYWEDGAQITPPHDKNILAEVAQVRSFSQVKMMEECDARAEELFRVIGTDFDSLYLDAVRKQSVAKHAIRIRGVGENDIRNSRDGSECLKETGLSCAEEITIVYTPLHGAGCVSVRQLLSSLGFLRVYVVREQKNPDGNFPTVSYPNPEDDGAWELALRLAAEVDADLVLATDPDSDRLGLRVKDAASGQYIKFSGNMSGMILAEYLLRARKEAGTLPEDAVLVETIVTTDMAKAIAKDYGVELVEVLTGFKYIGEQIKIFEETGGRTFLFGLEESYGFLAGTYARDKDACVAAMLLCEAAAYYRARGKTLWDVMVELYEKYGYYREGLGTVSLKGIEGAAMIKQKMADYRTNPPRALGGNRVLAVRDYLSGIRKDQLSGEETKTGLPTSDVLYYELEENGWCCIRPSGTEPKIKYYFGVKDKTLKEADKKLETLRSELCGSAEDRK